MNVRSSLKVVVRFASLHKESYLIADVVKYLLRTRNDKDAVNVQNHHGKTLLHIAAATNNLPLCKLIINHECDKNAVMKHAVS